MSFASEQERMISKVFCAVMPLTFISRIDVIKQGKIHSFKGIVFINGDSLASVGYNDITLQLGDTIKISTSNGSEFVPIEEATDFDFDKWVESISAVVRDSVLA